MKTIGYFFGGLMKNIKQGIVTIIGWIRVSKHYPWIVIGCDPYLVTGSMIRRCEQNIKPGDIILRRYNGAVLSWFIPGRYSHSAIYIGNGLVVHALGDGVQKTDLIDFLRCDGYAVLRQKHPTEEVTAKAIRIAESYVGQDYDFDMNICEDYSNVGDVDVRTKSVYCHELVRSCYPDLMIEPIAPQLWNGMIRSERKQFLAQSFLESDDLTLVYDSFFSEVRSNSSR